MQHALPHEVGDGRAAIIEALVSNVASKRGWLFSCLMLHIVFSLIPRLIRWGECKEIPFGRQYDSISSIPSPDEGAALDKFREEVSQCWSIAELGALVFG